MDIYIKKERQLEKDGRNLRNKNDHENEDKLMGFRWTHR